MARAITPNASAGGNGAAWLIPIVAVIALVAAGVLELAGALVSGLTGHGWRFAPFTSTALKTIVTHGLGAYWPGVDPKAIGLVAIGLGVLIIGPPLAFGLVKVLGAPAADDPRRSLAGPRQLAQLTYPAAAQRARRLRRSLAAVKPKDISAADIGVLLGRLGSATVFSSWEDVIVAIMAARSGKSSTLATPAVLAAPGAVVLTSNKSDVWAATGALRAQRTGERVWTFDPQAVTHTPQTWWINLLDGVTTIEEAERLAGHFVLTVDNDKGNRDIWGPAASELLSSLLLAAALGGRTIIDVYEWLSDEKTPEPAALLRQAGESLLARTLQAVQDRPAETRGSVYFTAQAATKCLRNRQITSWVTPPPQGLELDLFDAATFATSRQSIYLLSKDGGGSAAPLVAAITDRIMRAGVVAAERRGGRLDPPMLVMLDEAGNVCKIADLPQLYSHLGSRGIIPVTILQSYKQGAGVWGDNGMDTLWAAATVKLLGPGVDDPDFAEEISRLVGDHDVSTVSYSSGGRSGSSRSVSVRQQRILPAAKVRELPKFTGLLLATATRPAMLKLQPYFLGPDRDAIAAAAAAAEHLVEEWSQADTQTATRPQPTVLPA